MIFFKGSKLQFYNLFSYKTGEDFIYFLLAALEQLKLNPERAEVVLMGAIEKNFQLYDLVFRYIGEAGLYQIIIYVLLGLPSYFSGYQNIAMTFLAPDQEHWCAVDRLLEFPHKQQKYVGE